MRRRTESPQTIIRTLSIGILLFDIFNLIVFSFGCIYIFLDAWRWIELIDRNFLKIFCNLLEFSLFTRRSYKVKLLLVLSFSKI